MPDGNQIVAQSADGAQHIFPAGTDPAVIDRAMKVYVSAKQPGAFQQRPGGPILNSKTLAPSGDTGATPGSMAREAALGTFGGMGIAETSSPVTDTIKNLVQSVGTMMGSGAWTGQKTAGDVLAAQPPVALAKSLYGGLKDIYGGGVRGGINPDSNQVAHGMGNLTGTAATMGLLKGTPEAVSGAGESMASVGREVVGEGASKVRVLSDQHAHALEVQKHIAGVADAVHQDAQQAMSSVSQTVDAAKPQGAFDKLDVKNRLTDAMGDKLADQNQLPASLRKLLATEAPSYDAQMIKNTQGYVSKLKQSGLNDQGIQAALKQQGLKPAEIEAAMGTNPGAMTFEDLKQARSDLGRQLDRLQGPAQAAAKSAYGEMSNMLREGARDAGVEPDWLDATARWKNYLDDFQRSPVAKTLEADSAHDIMDPLAGKSRMQVADILQKYEPFGLDMTKVSQEIGRFGMGNTVMNLSKPGKMDLLLARLSPSAVALRQIGPRIMRNPKIFDKVMGEGFEAENIPSKKVYPTKEAAAAALKGTKP